MDIRSEILKIVEKSQRSAWDRRMTTDIDKYTDDILALLVKYVEEKNKEYFKTHKEAMYIPYNQALFDLIQGLGK
jgi:hypothetical protein